MSSQSNRSALHVAQPLQPVVLDETIAPVATSAAAANANAEPTPIAALDALALCAASGAMGA